MDIIQEKICFAIFIVKSYGYIASLFSMIRYNLTCSWQKSTVYGVLHQRVIITCLCYPVKLWTDPSCSKTWHNLYRMNTPHLHVGYVLCWDILHYGGGRGDTPYRYFWFVFFSPYLAYEYEYWWCEVRCWRRTGTSPGRPSDVPSASVSDRLSPPVKASALL